MKDPRRRRSRHSWLGIATCAPHHDVTHPPTHRPNLSRVGHRPAARHDSVPRKYLVQSRVVGSERLHPVRAVDGVKCTPEVDISTRCCHSVELGRALVGRHRVARNFNDSCDASASDLIQLGISDDVQGGHRAVMPHRKVGGTGYGDVEDPVRSPAPPRCKNRWNCRPERTPNSRST